MRIGAVGRMDDGVYNVYRIPRVSREDISKNDVSKVSEVKEKPDISESDLQSQSEEQRKVVSPINLEDISIKFNAGETYDYIGKDKDIQNLDIKKAVSDMQKDQVLEQYQFFVGKQDASGILVNNSDGMVLCK